MCLIDYKKDSNNVDTRQWFLEFNHLQKIFVKSNEIEKERNKGKKKNMIEEGQQFAVIEDSHLYWWNTAYLREWKGRGNEDIPFSDRIGFLRLRIRLILPIWPCVLQPPLFLSHSLSFYHFSFTYLNEMLTLANKCKYVLDVG